MAKRKHICEECGKEFEDYFDSTRFCSRECYNTNKSKDCFKICPICGKEFKRKTKNQIFCSNECKFKSFDTRIEFNCEHCWKLVVQKKSEYNKNEHHYCSQECHYKAHHEVTICSNCGKEFDSKKGRSRKFCSIECRNEYFGKEQTRIANENPLRKRICKQCGKEFYASPSAKKDCCSIECKTKWLKENLYNTEEYKAKHRHNMINRAKNPDYLLTGIQLKINELLERMNIKYENEKSFTYYFMDNYLSDYNLGIEVMGEYWHCSILRFKKPINNIQITGIKRDKQKRYYIKTNYNIEILYLWEKDIDDNIELCEKLIELYIKHNGILDNYNSFNYELVDGNIKLKDNIIIPYQEMPSKKLNEILKD